MNKTNRRGRGPEKRGRPVGTNRGPYKARRSDKAGTGDKQMDYMRGLSTLVNKACDEWLRKRGVAPQDWRSKKDADYKKRQAS